MNCLKSAPIVSCPNPEIQFTIQSDSSDYGKAGVLMQVREGNKDVICVLRVEVLG